MKSQTALAIAPAPEPEVEAKAPPSARARLRLYTREGAAAPSPAPAQPRGREDALRYLPFVRRIAVRLARGLPSHVPLDDLVSAGMIGLIDALDRFDPKKGQRFETYAEFRVRGAMLDDLRRADMMARDARLESKRIQRSIAELTQKLGRPPEEEDLAAHLEVSVDSLRRTLQKLGHVQVFSLDDLAQRDPEAFGGIQSGDDPYEHAMISEVQRKLTEAIPRLPPRLRMALTLHYH